MQDFEKNGNRALKYRLLIFSALCAALCVLPIIVIATTKATNAFAPLIYVLAFLAMFLIVVFTVVYAIVGHRLLSYRLDESGLTVKKGFIFKKMTFMPCDKIKGVKIIKNRFIFKDLCTVVFQNDSGDFYYSGADYDRSVLYLKERFKDFYLNEEI